MKAIIELDVSTLRRHSKAGEPKPGEVIDALLSQFVRASVEDESQSYWKIGLPDNWVCAIVDYLQLTDDHGNTLSRMGYYGNKP